MIEINEAFDLCEIWKIRNQKSKILTFQQSHVTGYIQIKNYFFVSNMLQESVAKVDIIGSFSSDHSPILLEAQF